MSDSTINAHTALVYLMVLVSASDRDMSDSELKRMGDLVQTLRIFNGYDMEQLVNDAETCAEILDDDEGLDTAVNMVKAAIPASHVDTAYAVACEVAVADDTLTQEELRILEIIRHRLGVGRLTAAAIERGAAARARSL